MAGVFSASAQENPRRGNERAIERLRGVGLQVVTHSEHGALATSEPPSGDVHFDEQERRLDVAWTACGVRDTRVSLALEDDGLAMTRGVLGGNSMYFAHDGDSIVASTSLATLQALRGGSPRVANASVGAYVALGAWPTGETVFEDVFRVRGAERVRLRRAGLPGHTVREGFEPSPALVRDLVPFEGTIDEAAEGLWATIMAVVEASTEHHQHVAVLGGGGLDSGALLAATIAASRGASAREVTNVFMAFDGPESDRSYHRDLTQSLGITPVIVNPADATHVPLDACLDAHPYPVPTLPFDLAWHHAAKRAGATVVMTGAGGDELFGGDLRYLAQWMGTAPMATLREALALRVPWPTTRLSRLREWIAQPNAKAYVPAHLTAASLYARGRKRMPWLAPAAREHVWEASLSQARERADLSPMGRFLFESSAPSWVDFADARTQLEQEAGIARADPFLSEALLRFLVRVPMRVLFADRMHRGLLRRALVGRVPESLRLRSGKAEFEPALYAALANGAFSTMLRGVEEAKSTSALGFVDGGRYRQAHRALLAAPEAGISWCDLWQTMSAEAFLNQRA